MSVNVKPAQRAIGTVPTIGIGRVRFADEVADLVQTLGFASDLEARYELHRIAMRVCHSACFTLT